ncbi:probable peptidoglycan muropeptide transporter SLC46 [Culicoides brevitarsis]|uniref:probable peptidoglycan muropeptide transporter SLC46 n=1 Tax=Culicoides brevitarsis TaxID=469753 RepID=UPI00307BD817
MSEPSASSSVETLATASLDGDQPSRRFFTLEPVVLLLFFAYNLGATVFVDQIIFQVCVSELKYNFSDCVVLGTNNESEAVQDLEKRVQPYVTDLIMTKSLVEALVPAFLSLFIGPWSDIFGRKPIITASLLGFFLTYLLICILCAFSDVYIINPWYYVLASIPVATLGGVCTMITGIYCYIADITTEKNRAVKMGVVEAALFVGLLLGSGLSSYIYALTNTTTVFGIAAGAVLIAFLYTIFFIEESKQMSELDSRASMFRELFRLELVRDMFAVCFKRRPNHDRAIIWMVMISLGFSIFIMEGNQQVFFLFVRDKFAWDVRKYTIYATTNTVSLIFGNLIAMYGLKKFFKLSETTLAIIAFSSCFLDSIISAVAFISWHLYLGIGLTLLKGLVSPMCRSILATTSEHSNTSGNEIGKLYSFTTSLESLMPMAAVPLYTQVYKATLESGFPGAFNVISAVIYAGIIVCMVLVSVFQRFYHPISYSNVIVNS